MKLKSTPILAEYGFTYEFPPEVEAEADKIDRKITAAEVKNAEICVKFSLYH